jgi:hypothetical protein
MSFVKFPFKLATNEQVLPMAGYLKNVRPELLPNKKLKPKLTTKAE